MARCIARSSQTGLPCRAYAIHGGTVCVAHGGAAPQVKRKAEERIVELRDVAVEKFLMQLQCDDVPASTMLAAVRDLTKTVAEMQDRDSSASSTSVIDEWSRSLRGGK